MSGPDQREMGDALEMAPDADAIYRRAVKHPGIREVMRVYEDWKRVDHGLDPYRGVTVGFPVTRIWNGSDDG